MRSIFSTEREVLCSEALQRMVTVPPHVFIMMRNTYLVTSREKPLEAYIQAIRSIIIQEYKDHDGFRVYARETLILTKDRYNIADSLVTKRSRDMDEVEEKTLLSRAQAESYARRLQYSFRQEDLDDVSKRFMKDYYQE